MYSWATRLVRFSTSKTYWFNSWRSHSNSMWARNVCLSYLMSGRTVHCLLKLIYLSPTHPRMVSILKIWWKRYKKTYTRLWDSLTLSTVMPPKWWYPWLYSYPIWESVSITFSAFLTMTSSWSCFALNFWWSTNFRSSLSSCISCPGSFTIKLASTSKMSKFHKSLQCSL